MPKLTKNEFVRTTENGRIWRYRKNFDVKVTKDNFYEIYIQHLQQEFQVLNGTDKKVLAYMMRKADENGKINEKGFAKRVSRVTTLNYQAVLNAMSSLKKYKFVEGGYGNFRINPKYYYKIEDLEDILVNGECVVQLKFKVE